MLLPIELTFGPLGKLLLQPLIAVIHVPFKSCEQLLRSFQIFLVSFF